MCRGEPQVGDVTEDTHGGRADDQRRDRRDHGGHGIGRTMHEDPHVPNEGRPGKGMRLQPGLVIAIEPMSPEREVPQIATGTDDNTPDPDGWTLRTASGARAAHSEHTVTADGARILTS
jgi:methionyl aminopeptidase